MNGQVTAPSAMVRVSIVSEDRRLDVGVPASLPLVELLPGFARSLGVLDPTLVHAGYGLRRSSGDSLDSRLSAAAQGVRDGEVLTLVRGGLIAEPQVYDDITEAVIDATVTQHGAWTPKDGSLTALAVSLTFLGLCAVLLISAGRELALGPIIAAGGAVLLLTISGVLNRLDHHEPGNALGIAGAIYAGIAGMLAVTGATYGLPMAAAGLAVAVAGGIALGLAPRNREWHLASISGGIAVAIPAAIAGWHQAAGLGAFAMVIALIGATSNLLPWLALTSTRIRVISPQTEQEVFADPPRIDATTVTERAASGARTLLALRVGLGAAVLISTPLLASASVPGAILTAFTFAGMMFQSRQAYARSAVITVMTLGTVGLAVTGLTITFARPDLHTPMLFLAVTVTAVLVAVTLVSPRVRLSFSRLVDTVEVILMALIVPLGVIAAGWI